MHIFSPNSPKLKTILTDHKKIVLSFYFTHSNQVSAEFSMYIHIFKNIYIAIYISKFTLQISNKKKTTKKTEKYPGIKSILFLILHMMSNFYLIWTTNKNTVVSHRKENFIENGKHRIFLYISYFNLAISSLCIIRSILVKIT